MIYARLQNMKMHGIRSIGSLLDASFPRTRESRFDLRPISLDTRFRGYDGTQIPSSFWRPSPHMYFRRRTRRARSSETWSSESFASLVLLSGIICAAWANFSMRQSHARGCQTRSYDSRYFLRVLHCNSSQFGKLAQIFRSLSVRSSSL